MPTTFHLQCTFMNTEPLSVSSTSATSQTPITSLSTRSTDTTNKTTPNIHVHPTNIQNRERKTTKEHPKGTATRLFFRQRQEIHSKQQMTMHNLSSFELSHTDIQVLTKGLSFAPTPYYNKKAQFELLKEYDKFSDSIRTQYDIYKKKQPQPALYEHLDSKQIFRKMKFLPRNTSTQHPWPTNNSAIDPKSMRTRIGGTQN